MTILTKRETEVLLLVCEGQSNLEIAAGLAISEHTVSEYIKNIYLKYQVNNRIALFRKALVLGVVGCPATKCKLLNNENKDIPQMR
jgi:two-component system secretion system response regulator SalR